METNSQTATEGRSRTFAVTSKDGTRKVFRQGAGDDGPVPLDDEELEAVSGGGEWTFNWTGCGCVELIEADTYQEAELLAEAYHAQLIADGHCIGS